MFALVGMHVGSDLDASFEISLPNDDETRHEYSHFLIKRLLGPIDDPGAK